jgi:UDP-N-acetylmuramate dehydrogenase
MSEPAVTGEVRRNEPMARHTSFRIGGPADILVIPANEEDVIEAVRWANAEGLPLTVLGNGTNVLVSDKGIRGVTVIIGPGLNDFRVEGLSITAGCGAPLMKVAVRAAQLGLSGLEFAEGIPGTLGGAIYMNAGTSLGSVKDCLHDVRAVRRDGEVVTLAAEDLRLDYRRSILPETRDILLAACFHLRPGRPEEVAGAMQRLRRRRHEGQPHLERSAGCVFKNPPGLSAGRLLDLAGAKGRQHGGATVSDKHANFIINARDATASDVLRLMRSLRSLIEERHGIRLEPEIEFVGEWDETL